MTSPSRQDPVKTDVVICGAGSAGICAALWLARLGVGFRMLERRDSALAVAQADGVQCRTVEIFDSFEIADQLVREAYHVNELTFWNTDATSGQLTRQSTAPDTPLGISHQPHVILNQARVNEIMLQRVHEYCPSLQVDYNSDVIGVVHDKCELDYPVRVQFNRGGKLHEYKAKYVLASDGAHSKIRRSLSIDMVGDTADAVWGVMDIYPITDFPDIRKKSTIRSSQGALVIIPREGNLMVRFYLQMPSGTTANGVTLEVLHSSAKAILQGFTIEFAKTAWWSAYTIGQRVASSFDALDGRVFLAGDACHTHSPKAGQGMNVSLQDGYNIGWKLSQVLRGVLSPKILETYAEERRNVAQDLINFDRRLTQLYHEPPETFQAHFLQSAAYMAGVTNSYVDTALTSTVISDSVAGSLSVGSRCSNAKVTRHSDALVMDFHRALPSNGYWRLAVLPGEIPRDDLSAKLENICRLFDATLHSTAHNASKSIHLAEFVEPLLVLAGDRASIEPSHIPVQFYPVNNSFLIRDTTKVFVDEVKYKEGEKGVYEAFGVDPMVGALILIRPDQHIALKVLPQNTSVVQEFLAAVV